jgi:hypothetical protein
MLISRTAFKIGLIALATTQLMGADPLLEEKIERSEELIQLFRRYSDCKNSLEFDECLKLIEEKLNAGVDLNIGTQCGALPLFEVLRQYQKKIGCQIPFSIIERMVRYKHDMYQQVPTNVNSIEQYGGRRTLLGLLVMNIDFQCDEYGASEHAKSEGLKIAKLLLDHGADPSPESIFDDGLSIKKMVELYRRPLRNKEASAVYNFIIQAKQN